MYDDENGRYITDKIIELTSLENRILKLLIMNKGKVITYKQIVEEIYFEIYDKEDAGQRKKIHSCIRRLKEKLGSEVEFINKKNIGYIIGKF